MGQTADQIKNEIENQRQALGENLQQLESKVKETVDWRTQFQQRPMAGVGLAFAGGFLLSMLMPGGDDAKSGSGSSQRDISNYRVGDESGSSTSYPTMSYVSSGPQQPSKQPKPRSPEMSEITETLENIRGAVMGIAATRLRTWLAEAVPGFEDEYEEARRRRGASEASRIAATGSSASSGASTSGSSGSGASAGVSTGSSSGSGSSYSGAGSSSQPSGWHDVTAQTQTRASEQADTALSGYLSSSEGGSGTSPRPSNT